MALKIRPTPRSNGDQNTNRIVGLKAKKMELFFNEYTCNSRLN